VSKGGAEGLTLGIRPQGLSLGSGGVPAEVVVVEELGAETFVFVEVEHLGETTRIRVRVDAEYQVTRGDHTSIDVLGPAHVFGADGLRLKTAAEQGD
jgi:multiple sugar transport system ATP-binding protein